MPCVLSASPKPAVDFEGPAGSPFTITIVPAPGSSLRQTAATYDGVTVAGNSAPFTLAKGVRTLVVTYAAAKLKETGDLSEVCSPGSTKPLRGIRSTAVFTRVYLVEGL